MKDAVERAAEYREKVIGTDPGAWLKAAGVKRVPAWVRRAQAGTLPVKVRNGVTDERSDMTASERDAAGLWP